MSPVGVGKKFMASALGNIACRRRHSLLMLRADRILKRLKAAGLDASHEAELRKLIRVDLLSVDDFALHQLDQTETQDIYDIVVERHRRTSTIVTSNRSPEEWLPTMADPLLTQSAIDRLQSAAYELIVEGESIAVVRSRSEGKRDDASVSMAVPGLGLLQGAKWSHVGENEVVPTY